MSVSARAVSTRFLCRRRRNLVEVKLVQSLVKMSVAPNALNATACCVKTRLHLASSYDSAFGIRLLSDIFFARAPRCDRRVRPDRSRARTRPTRDFAPTCGARRTGGCTTRRAFPGRLPCSLRTRHPRSNPRATLPPFPVARAPLAAPRGMRAAAPPLRFWDESEHKKAHFSRKWQLKHLGTQEASLEKNERRAEKSTRAFILCTRSAEGAAASFLTRENFHASRADETILPKRHRSNTHAKMKNHK